MEEEASNLERSGGVEKKGGKRISKLFRLKARQIFNGEERDPSSPFPSPGIFLSYPLRFAFFFRPYLSKEIPPTSPSQRAGAKKNPFDKFEKTLAPQKNFLKVAVAVVQQVQAQEFFEEARGY